MSPTRPILAALLLLAAVILSPAAAPPGQPLPAEITRWVEELGDDSFAVREEASRKLRNAGSAGEPQLVQALNSTDAEVVRRARDILAEFRWGIYPDTPAAIVTLIKDYRSAARSERGAVLEKLLAAGPPGCRAVVRIARAEDDPAVRSEVFTRLTANLLPTVARLLDENHPEAIDGLLELALAGNPRAGVLHYSAYYLLTGRLPARIADWEVQARKAVVARSEQEVLAYLYRAGENSARARLAAAESERKDLLEALLYEQGDWKELARRTDLPDTPDRPRWLAYRAAYTRLAGDRDGHTSAIDDLLTQAGPIAQSRGNVLPFVKALFLNGRANDAVSLLEKSRHDPKLLYEVLVAQMRIKEAFALVEAAGKPQSRHQAVLEILQARTLYHLGEKDRALATLKKYTDLVALEPGATWCRELVEAELATGRRDQAFAVAGKVLGGSRGEEAIASLLDRLFENDGETAAALWVVLGKVTPARPREKTLDPVRAFLEGKAKPADLDELARVIGTWAEKATPVEAAEAWRVLGEVFVRGKRPKEAAAHFRRAGSTQAWIRLGDLLAEQKQWQKAAEHYHTAYSLARKGQPGRGHDDATLALSLYLSGHALVQAGQPREGRVRIDRAHLIPLGDGSVRHDLVRELRRRGHRDGVRREQEYLRRLGEPVLTEPDSYYTGEGLRGAAIAAAARKDWLRAADGYEQTFLRCLQPGLNFARPAAYVTVPAHIYLQRARGLLAAGRIDEALTESARTRACLPGSVDLAMTLVPELDRRGRKKDAEALFRAVQGEHEAVLRAYPRCSWAFNQSAWLSACCRRNLSQGLEHARKAVALAPDSAAYHDTLAEVLFQLGKKDEAIVAQKKALALQPGREYFKKQLKRLQAGDPSAPRPEEDD